MAHWELKHQVKYEKDLDHNFYKQVGTESWGEKLLTCIQCGNCSGACPLSLYMDFTPRQIIAMVRAGFKEEVLSSNTIWLCSSCYNCTVECTKEIRITDVMYGLKQIALKEKKHPKNFPSSVLAEEFFKQVQKNGRMSEGWLIGSLYLRTGIFGAMNQAVMGMKLVSQGRIGPKTESIPMGHGGKGDLKKILDACDDLPDIETAD